MLDIGIVLGGLHYDTLVFGYPEVPAPPSNFDLTFLAFYSCLSIFKEKP